MGIRKLGAALALAAAFAVPQSAVAQAVDVELALLIDVSGSVSTTEFNLQRQGYVDAFNNAAIQAAFDAGRTIAVTVVYWSTGSSVVVPWTLVNSAASSAALATAIASAARTSSGSTGPGSAINAVLPSFASNSFTSLTQIIDVSGDGAQNVGASTSAARDAALAAGIDQINGLPILGEAGLEAWYNANIKGGTGAFVIPANSFDDFGAAILTKLGREIITPPDVPPVTPPIPEPETYALMAAGLAALGFVSRRRKKAAAG